MIALCPAAPAAKSDLDVTLAELRVNSELVRSHPPAYGGNAFNPNTGRKMADPTAGARFSPFVPGRAESLAEGELIHTKAAVYPGTRAWARYFHDSLPHLEGLAWRPRLGGEGLANVFFGDLVAPTEFEIVESATPIDTGSGRELIDVIAGEAHIVIIAVR